MKRKGDLPDASTQPFERKLRIDEQIHLDQPGGTTFRQACVNVNDTLEYAWASVRQVFGDKAKPEHALECCKVMVLEHARLLESEDGLEDEDNDEEESDDDE